MNKQQLIEDARAAFTKAWEEKDAELRDQGQLSDGTAHQRSRAGIEAAFAVFEQGHSCYAIPGACSFLPVASVVQETAHTDDEDRAFAWAEYRKDYEPNPAHFAREAVAFRAGWEARTADECRCSERQVQYPNGEWSREVEVDWRECAVHGAPSDDQREARVRLVDAIKGHAIDQRVPYEDEIDDLVLTVRTVQCEPSREDLTEAISNAFYGNHYDPSGHAADAVLALIHRTVQGEPSDAQVRAAAESIARDDGIRVDLVPEWADSYMSIARDALRAAANAI